MARAIKLSGLERRILDRVLSASAGFEDAEELLAAMGAERNQFVDALETLTEEGCLTVHNLGGCVVVGFGDALGQTTPPDLGTLRVGHC